jgi:hypothetical protein
MIFDLPERATIGYPNFVCKMGAKILATIPEPLNAKNPRKIRT